MCDLTYARIYFVYMCEFPQKETTTQLPKLNALAFTLPMKNTSLLVLLGNAKRTPSVEPTECKCARFRALGGRQVIGLQALIASYR